MSAKKVDLVDEIHRASRKNYPRRRVELKGLNDLWQIDLAKMIPYASSNQGYKYILMCINAFSKYGWCKPLKSKGRFEIVKAVQSILQSTTPPKLIQTDRGTEFFNVDFKRLMEKYKIKHYSSFSKLKASIVERWIRTIKSNLWKQFNLRGNYRWSDIIQSVVQKYNAQKHSVIKMAPKDVTRSHEKKLLAIFQGLQRKMPLLDKMKFKEGDLVRVSKNKMIFEKGYTPNWSTELFKIVSVHRTNPITYAIRDLHNETIMGRFYTEELQKANIKDVYLVEKVLRRRGNKILVKWLGFGENENSWVNKKDLG